MFWTLPSERASEGDDEDSLPPSSFHSQSHTQMSGRSGRLSVREGPDSGLDGRRRRWNRSLRSRGQFYLGVGQVGGAPGRAGKEGRGKEGGQGADGRRKANFNHSIALLSLFALSRRRLRKLFRFEFRVVRILKGAVRSFVRPSVRESGVEYRNGRLNIFRRSRTTFGRL